MAEGGEPGRLQRIRELVAMAASNYIGEIAVALLVCGLFETLLSILGSPLADVFTEYEYVMVGLVLMLILIATIIMFNTARSRVSAAEILEEVQHGKEDDIT